MTVTKTKALQMATRQSQAAQRVTSAMRVHGYRERLAGHADNVGAMFRPSTDEDRREWAQEALDAAREVARDADAILSWVEAWARQEGAE